MSKLEILRVDKDEKRNEKSNNKGHDYNIYIKNKHEVANNMMITKI